MDQIISSKFQKAFILILLVIVLIGFIGMIQEFVIALVLAAIFAGLFYPLYNKILTLVKNRSALAAAIILIIAILGIGLPMTVLAGMITNEAIQITQKATPIVKELLDQNITLSQYIPNWLPMQDKLQSLDESILTKASQAASSLGSWIVTGLSSATKGTIGFLIGLFVLLYAMFYFLVEGPKLLAFLGSLVPLVKDDYKKLMNRGLMVTRASLKGIIIIGLIQAILVSIAFWITGIEGAIFWGSIVFLLSAIPGLGAPLVWIPAAGYLFFTGDIQWSVALTLWGILVIGLVDNLLRPWIVGNEAKLPDIVILVSILGGITTFGAVGIILGPVIAALLDTLLNIYKKSLNP